MTALTPHTQAVLLLTARFSKLSGDTTRPLTPKEWGRFATWLTERHARPEQLFDNGLIESLSTWQDKTITPERVRNLMGRSAALALAVEKWQRAGLWILTRSDPDYPSRLKARLKADSPPVFFGCGNRALLSARGIAVVGSRDASAVDLADTARVARDIAGQGYSVISGGARGVDESAMLAALECGGTVVGVLSDSLMRSVTSSKYRDGLINKNLVLVSSFHPEAGFDVGNAMTRNRYVYCLSDAAIVMTASQGKGGTWSGAMENLKHGWVPLWVRRIGSASQASAAMVSKGAFWLSDGTLEAQRLGGEPPVQHVREGGDLFGTTAAVQPTSSEEALENGEAGANLRLGDPMRRRGGSPGASRVLTEPAGFFDLFLVQLRSATEDEAQSVDQLSRRFGVNKAQIGEWLKIAVTDGQAERLSKPVRYRSRRQESLFDEA